MNHVTKVNKEAFQRKSRRTNYIKQANQPTNPISQRLQFNKDNIPNIESFILLNTFQSITSMMQWVLYLFVEDCDSDTVKQLRHHHQSDVGFRWTRPLVTIEQPQWLVARWLPCSSCFGTVWVVLSCVVVHFPYSNREIYENDLAGRLRVHLLVRRIYSKKTRKLWKRLKNFYENSPYFTLTVRESLQVENRVNRHREKKTFHVIFLLFFLFFE